MHSLTLANGLEVRLHHAPGLKRAAAFLRVAVGSHDAPTAWPGLAHFLEHLLFLGTERFSGDQALMAFVQQQGGQINASTRERNTDFFFEVPASALQASLERLCDMLAHARLALPDQRRERDVLHAEFIAWQNSAEAHQQHWLLAPLNARHPLRRFHAGNRYTLRVADPGFQRDLAEFYRAFYQAGQMTLCIAAPQPLATLEHYACQAGAQLPEGTFTAQHPPPALLGPPTEGPGAASPSGLSLAFACEGLPAGADDALGMLAAHLQSSQVGGLLAALRQQGWAQSLKLEVPYHFADQALLDLQLNLTPAGSEQRGHIAALCLEWLAFFAQAVDPSKLHQEYLQLEQRRLARASALTLARHGATNRERGAGPAAFQAMLQRLTRANVLHRLPELPTRTPQANWHLPPPNPFLQRPARGAARDAPPSAMHYVPLAGSHEAWLQIRWRLAPDTPSGLFESAQAELQTLQEHAQQAGVDVSFSHVQHDWLLRLQGLPAPLPAVLEQALARLAALPWRAGPVAPAPAQMAIRQLLDRLPGHCQEAVQVGATTGGWSAAQWHGLALGVEQPLQGPLNAVLAQAPGRPYDCLQAPRPWQGKVWQQVECPGNEHALLLFCPAPSPSMADEAAWRLLAQWLQGPFYQQLRVERQLGYAVFSGVRQIAGRCGLLFGVQSPHASLGQILGHIEAFIARLGSWVEQADAAAVHAQAQTLAARLSLDAMELADAGEWLWQARLAGHHPANLEALKQAVANTRQAELRAAVSALQRADGGWRCLANGPPAGPQWHSLG
ncbi:pyrroloquinoline quinone biosynthesis protein PqqF [Pseudomonas sp. nanlin1]|uniref:pyrroloquinoline quinone biosynthesis protein PqqF n=1 Tax=Pseudomonas sp. nanlin1 TaxID=3040605 RepID=UPI00388EAF1B